MDEQFVNELAVALRKVGTIHTVGEEWHSYTGEIPVGGVPYCGQMVTRATYSALWKYAQEKYLVLDEANWQMYAQANGGNVPFYSSGDGSTTFRMPKIVGYVKGASSQSEAGTHLFEGLPNIVGEAMPASDVGLIANSGGIVDGAFTKGSLTGRYISSGGSGYNSLKLDASLSNSIYGASDHVTPETSVVLFGVYAFGAIIETGALDATTLATGLARVEANKVEVESWSNGTLWYRKYSDGWIEQGGLFDNGILANAFVGNVTFPTPFTSDPNTVVAQTVRKANNDALYTYVSIGTISNTQFYFRTNHVSDGGCRYVSWYACGY